MKNKNTTNIGENSVELAVHGLSPKTSELLDAILNQSKHFTNYRELTFVINPEVFPFDSISHSSIAMADYLPKEPCEKVLDMGTGCGLQAIVAYTRGAKSVLAVDIDSRAVENAKENIERLGLEDNIEVLKSDLFDSVPLVKFDKILAQLPFSNIDHKCSISHLLFDPLFILHERFLSQANRYLKQDGRIFLAGGELGDEKRLYSLIEKYGYSLVNESTSISNNVRWKVYELVQNAHGGIKR